MEQISCSLFIDKSQFDHAMFRDVRRMVRVDVIDKLNAAGRSFESIEWTEGPYVIGKPFPLSIEFGPNPDSYMYRIIGKCRIPSVNVKRDQISI